MAPSKIERQIWPAVVAHRGASLTHPENTIESFLAAARAGADMVELDVRMTADNVAVVLHDLDVSRTTEGSGFVHLMSLKEVKALDASRGRGPRAEIPTLGEALDALSGRIGLDIEIKNLPGEPSFDSPREAAVEEALRLIHETKFDGIVLISSFNWLSIEKSKERSPDVPTGLITTAAVDPWAALVYARTHGHDLLLPQASAVVEVGEAFIEAAHGDGVRIGTWTVDDAQQIERLFAMGVDAIATNDPAVAVPIRDRFRAASG
jgi:glycerophosphoryl diester phosphodiesterase